MNSAIHQLALIFQRGFATSTDHGESSSPAMFTPDNTPLEKQHWMNALADRMVKLMTLPIGWDGYRGQPVSLQCGYFAVQMLMRLYQENVSPPSLVPGSSGSIQLEWHENGYDVELEVLGAHDVSAYRYNLATKEEEEFEIQDDFSKIVGWISALADPAENAG